MIRPVRPHELDKVVSLWLTSTIQAHPFIPARYWHESLPIVRDTYLPHAMTWVYCKDKEIVGFISILDSRFVGALFVAEAFFGQSVGAALMQHVQQRFPMLSLEVYQENKRAVRFYHKQGFVITEAAWQADTHQATWIMHWQNN